MFPFKRHKGWEITQVPVHNSDYSLRYECQERNSVSGRVQKLVYLKKNGKQEDLN